MFLKYASLANFQNLPFVSRRPIFHTKISLNTQYHFIEHSPYVKHTNTYVKFPLSLYANNQKCLSKDNSAKTTDSFHTITVINKTCYQQNLLCYQIISSSFFDRMSSYQAISCLGIQQALCCCCCCCCC